MELQSVFQGSQANINEFFNLFFIYLCFTSSAVYSLTPRFNKIIVLLSTIPLWYFSYFHVHFSGDFPAFIGIIEFSLVIPWTIIMFKDKFLKRLLYGFLIMLMFAFGDVFEYILHILLHQSEPDYSNISHCLISLIAIPLVVILITFIWNKFTKRNTINKINNNYIVIPIIIISELIIAFTLIFLFSVIFDTLTVHYQSTLITAGTLSAVVLVLMDIVTFHALIKNNKYQKLKTQNEILEKTSAIQADYYNKIQENITETAKIRHDIYNLISVTNILIEENSQESKAEAKKNMQNIAEIMDKTKTKFYCDNKLINTVLYDKIGAAENKGITVDSRINIREEYKSIDNFDLCRIFINIIDNAINALDTYSGKKHFSISCDEKDNKLHIMCENPFDANTVTNKDDKNHGYGLNIVKDIAEKYNGNVILNNKDNIFRILITLPI